MEYIKIKHIKDPLFKQFHELMGRIFPKEEVLEFELWREPLLDPLIRMFVAVENGEVVGATEYRYYSDLNIAMKDFTLIGCEGKGIGKFLADRRLEDLKALAAAAHNEILGMFAEIYNPHEVEEVKFGGVTAMSPFVRREVLSHLGYQRLDFNYCHPSWENDGSAVKGLDFCFMPFKKDVNSLPGEFVAKFLKTYYEILSNKPVEWVEMVENLERQEQVELKPI